MRYLPLSVADRQSMLGTIGVSSVDDLYVDVPDAAARGWEKIDLPRTQSEMAVERALTRMSSKSVAANDVPFFLGAGAYKHHIPATVDHLIQRSEFLTAYTPYQPEISQGTLQTLFEFQTQVALLTGMDVANASMYDGSTACAEAALMSARVTRRKKVILSGNLHPHYAEVVKTHLQYTENEVVCAPFSESGDEDLEAMIDDDTACVIVQTPDVLGHLSDRTALAEACHAKKALLVVAVTEVVSLGALKAPGEMGADIVVAEGASLGVGLQFGGPYLGLFATKQKYVRQMPGRLCGKTVDSEGKRGFVLTLSTREQHIRREKATSNICTNAGLCSLAFSIHVSLLGETGITRLAKLNHQAAQKLSRKLEAIEGVEKLNATYFNEFALRLPKPAAKVVEALARKSILGGVPLSRLMPDDGNVGNILLVAATEVNTEDDMDAFASELKEVLS